MSDKHRDSPNEVNDEQLQSRGQDHQHQDQPGRYGQSGQEPQGGYDSAPGAAPEAVDAGAGGGDAIEGEFLAAGSAGETDRHARDSSAAAQGPREEAVEAGNSAAEAVAEQGGEEGSAAAADQPAEPAQAQDSVQLQQRIEQLEADVEEARQQAETYRDQALRVRAEMENMQRRAQKDVEQAKRQGLEKLAAELLQVKDSLEMGVQAAEDEEADREKLLEGSQLTLKMLNQVFERSQIEELNPQGERFNPDYHEAMAAQPSNEQEPNTVLHVVQKGYRLEERLLRPALVVVAKRADDSSGEQSGGSVDESV